MSYQYGIKIPRHLTNDVHTYIENLKIDYQSYGYDEILFRSLEDRNSVGDYIERLLELDRMTRA